VGVSVAWKYDALGEAGQNVLQELEGDVEAKDTHKTTPTAETNETTQEGKDKDQTDKAASSAEEVAAVQAASSAEEVAAVQEDDSSKLQNPRSKLWWLMDKILIETVLGIPLDDSKLEPSPEMSSEKLATTCKSSYMAIVVFNTEEDRDQALQKGDLTFREQPLTLTNEEAEPLGVMWNNLEVPREAMGMRLIQSILIIVVSLLTWALVVYVPYAIYAGSFTYQNGDEPSFVVEKLMSVAVAMGNLIIYFVCFIAAERIGYAFEDKVQGVYLVMYVIAILLNLALDMFITAILAYRVADGTNARTVDGVLIRDLNSWHEILQTYELQKELGEQLFTYGWYSTYFLPFVLEALGLGWFMFHIARRWVRANPYLKGMAAEKAMQMFVPMDSARYGDLIVNVMVAELIWFVPSGYAAPAFLFLIFSHLFILALDYHRVLRWVPAFAFASDVIDWFAHTLMMIPIGFIPAAMVFKRNCVHKGSDSDDGFCVGDWRLAWMTVAAFVGHCCLHYLALKYVVPMCGSGVHKKTDAPYEKCAASVAPSFFNTNAMNCLRSKHVYKHDPPCTFYMRGKQHVLELNKEAQCYFKDDRRFMKESYGWW